MKSICPSLNFNFFFYLIDRSLELPKIYLNPIQVRGSCTFARSAGSTNKCFFTSTNKMILLRQSSKVRIRGFRRVRYSKPIPHHLPPLTVHSSFTWCATHLLNLTSYPLLGVAKTKHKTSKAPDKLFLFLKNHGLRNKIQRPLKSFYHRKITSRVGHKKLVLFKRFVYLSLERRSSDLALPFYKSVRLKRQPKSLKSRSSPYLFLNWNKTPLVSPNADIANLWTRFKKYYRVSAQSVKNTSVSIQSTKPVTRQKEVRRQMLSDILRKLKRDNNVWSRRLKRLVLNLRRPKTSWIKRLTLAQRKLPARRNTRDISPSVTSSSQIDVLNRPWPTNLARVHRANLNPITVPWIKPGYVKTTFQKSKFLPRKARVHTSHTFLARLNTMCSSSPHPQTRPYTPLLVHTRAIPFRILTRARSRNFKTTSQTRVRKQTFLYHSYSVNRLTNVRRFKRKRSRRTRRFFQKKSWKLLTPTWSNRLLYSKNSLRVPFITRASPIVNVGYNYLLTSSKLSSFLNPVYKSPSSSSRLTSWDFSYVLSSPLPRQVFLFNRSEKLSLQFRPDHSFLFTTSPFFFLNYIISIPKNLSDTSQVLKSGHRAKQFTVFPDSDAIKASFFRYVNRQKSLLQSRKHFYKSFASRHRYKPTRLLKSNLSKTNSFRVRAQDSLFSGLPRSPYWERLKNIHLLPRRVRNSAINRIRRIRFKPGYGRIWRAARVSVKDILGINTRYQYRLTPILQKQYFQSRNEKIENLAFTFGYALLSAKFANDTWVLNSLLANNNAFLNGVPCSNKNTRIFQNDFIQLIVNLKFYISLRWLKNWMFKKRSKVSKIFYKKIRPGITRGATKTPKLSRNLPNYFFNLEYSYSDIPQAFEVDYFSLSLFVVHDQLRFARYLPRKQFRINYSTLNMYNWKYIT